MTLKPPPAPLIFSCVLIALSGCAGPATVRPAAIDAALLAPEPIPQLRCDALACQVTLKGELVGALTRANGKILAIAETLRLQGQGRGQWPR